MNTIINRIENGQYVLIAEIGVNYYDIASKEGISPLDAAKLMILKAKEAGVHAVKFQTYKAETLAAKESPSYWDTTEETETSQYNLFKKFDSFGVKEYEALYQYSESIGIEFLSTAFDIESADYLDQMMNVYKISSSDLNNWHFVAHQAKKNKPILLSVGASNEEEIRKTIDVIREYNQQPIILLHCVLEYPTPYAHANLNKIVSLKRAFPDCYVGYSDHTKPEADYNILKTAYNLGAQVIEKHFTLDKTLSGNDHYHAMDEKDAAKIIETFDSLDVIRGSYELVCLESEQIARANARRSLVSNCDIKKGTLLTEEMITFKRPASGISAQEYDRLIGMTANEDIKEDTVLQWEMFHTCNPAQENR